MTRIAIMQPYFLPHAGYFRLMLGVDALVPDDRHQFRSAADLRETATWNWSRLYAPEVAATVLAVDPAWPEDERASSPPRSSTGSSGCRPGGPATTCSATGCSTWRSRPGVACSPRGALAAHLPIPLPHAYADEDLPARRFETRRCCRPLAGGMPRAADLHERMLKPP